MRRGLAEQLEGYRRLILQGDATEFCEIGPEAAERAARLRATYSISLMDALQVGVAITADCQAFMTNDRNLSRIAEIPVLVLDELE